MLAHRIWLSRVGVIGPYTVQIRFVRFYTFYKVTSGVILYDVRLSRSYMTYAYCSQTCTFQKTGTNKTYPTFTRHINIPKRIRISQRRRVRWQRRCRNLVTFRPAIPELTGLECVQRSVGIAFGLLWQRSLGGSHTARPTGLLARRLHDFSNRMWIVLYCLNFVLCIALLFCCRPVYCFHFRHLYLFYNCLWNFVCFIKAVISAPGAWLSCSSRLDARAVSLLDVLWANKWLLIDWLIENVLCTVDGREFCQFESFNATCPADQVILIDEARYGRLQLGRCVMCLL